MYGIHICMCIHGHALRGPPPPATKWSGKPPPSPPPMVWALVGLIGNPPPSFPRCGVGSGGWESSFLPFLWCGVWWGRLRAGKTWGRIRGPDGRAASLMRQTILCGRRFCSETLGWPFRRFGRPWRFLLGTIQHRVIKSVLMTSRPPIIYYTLCYILYTTYSRAYTIHYRLCSVYMVYLYTIARPLKGGEIKFFTHRFGPCGSPTIAYYSIL